MVKNVILVSNPVSFEQCCARCSATEHLKVKKKKITWYPLWIYVLLPLGLLPVLILYLVTRKELNVVYAFCPKHQKSTSKLLPWLFFIFALSFFIGSFILLAMSDTNDKQLDSPGEFLALGMFICSPLLLLISAVMLAVKSDKIHVKAYHKKSNQFAITGICLESEIAAE